MIDERIFVEILEQPWDGMVPVASAIPGLRNLPPSQSHSIPLLIISAQFLVVTFS